MSFFLRQWQTYRLQHSWWQFTTLVWWRLHRKYFAINPLPEMTLELIRVYKPDYLKIVLNYRMNQIPLRNCNKAKKALLTLNIYTKGFPRRISRGVAWSGRLWWRWECDFQTGCWPQTCSVPGGKAIVSIVTSSFLPPTDCVLFIPGLSKGIQHHPFQAFNQDLPSYLFTPLRLYQEFSLTKKTSQRWVSGSNL